ncbi:unnamed protein product [Plutella xylostella]|uniref:(diamondback moth) hypothetical protein n=1 Tax=Plutella xylostella TaxID=51655 RepID=A0A8S4GFQ2_PLUXY|nr:unnamed protein product [Plutella xylostella]
MQNTKRHKIPKDAIDQQTQILQLLVVHDIYKQVNQPATAACATIARQLRARPSLRGERRGGDEEGWRERMTKQLLRLESGVQHGRLPIDPLDQPEEVAIFHIDGKSIIFLDETYVNQNHATQKCWQSNTERGAMKNIGKGPRIIIVHAGSRNGFVHNALLMFKSHSKTGDYHGDMNATNFRKWIDEKLTPNIPPNSVIVMDNAAYHSTQIEKKPTMSSLKSDLQQWLERRGVQHDSSMRKCDLMKVIDEQNTEKKYKIDEILKENGHIVLRLPPYHPDLNPIELVWGYVKGELARTSIDSNLDKKIKDLELLFSNYSTEKWRNCDDHVIKNEDEYYKSDRVFDDVLDRFIIEVNENDDEDEDDDDDEQVQTESEYESDMEIDL